MSIPPLQQQPAGVATSAQPATRKETPVPSGGFFAEVLRATGAAKPPAITSESAATAAEVLRLEMMRSALTVNDPAQPPVDRMGTEALSTLLTAFRESSQKFVEPPAEHSPQAAAIEPVRPLAEQPQSAPAPVAETIRRASRRYGVDEGLIKAIIKAESNFNPCAVSSAGAQGLMQLMPATARGLGVTDSFNPEQNIMAGTRFLKDMLNRYNGNLEAALAAYNWGPGNVDRKGLTLPRETRDYIARVKGYFSHYAA